MYSAGYGFGNAPPNFNNQAAPQQQQPGAQQQQQQQHQQQLMYNQQQQFAGMAPQAFGPGATPQMMGGAPAGMMQNAGMQHMAPNGQMANYQQQFAGAPYGQVMPGSMNPQNFAPNNFMMAGGGGMQNFPMNQQGMPQQAPQQMMQQRMPQQQPHHQAMSQVSTPQRPPSTAHSTPSNPMPTQQGQFQPPQQPAMQSQPQGNFQPQGMDNMTPQTPNFPHNQQSQQGQTMASNVPTSPGADARDKERFALLLDINHELLYESIQIQTSQQEIKKELAAEGKLTPERKPTEEESILQQDYVQCMRRLQANLAYMATLADRKPETKPSPCPAYLTPPSLTLSVKLRAQPIVPEGGDFKIDPVTDREERDVAIKELYTRLQACFPGIDPTKEPVFRQPGPGMAQKPQGNPGFNQASPISQKTPQMTNMAVPPNLGVMGS